MEGDDRISEETILRPATDADGARTWRSTFSPSGQGRRKVLLAELPAVIPVVFLPGIMGTNLRHKDTGDAVWRPPNASFRPGDILGIIGALFTWGFRGAKERQELLRAEDLVVDDRGPIDVGGSGLSRQTARERGWGSVSRVTYHPIMATLQQRLNSISEMGEPLEWWAGEGRRDPADYGEELGGNDPLSLEELEHASRYSYDVWCAGYNWLASNLESGRGLKAYIEDVVFDHYRQRPALTGQVDRMKVILVTHSMGGFVSRVLTEIEGYDRVLGVVSGVQPATGAPATYHHMRCGYEGIARFILGRNAGQVTAVCANSPGALELVPSFDHHNGKPWLFACDEGAWDPDATHSMPLRLPLDGNPYEEIYKSSEWYGLVPKHNEKYLDFSGESAASPEAGPRFRLTSLLRKVEAFHREMSRKYHPATYAHYGADDAEAMHSWRDVVWQGAIGALSEGLADNGRGGYYSRQCRRAIALLSVPGSGDGTVCDRSGAAPGEAGVVASFRQGATGHGQFNHSLPGYRHQESYNDRNGGRTQWATLYGVAKAARNADWHPAE